jgi:hypothetical protein
MILIIFVKVLGKELKSNSLNAELKRYHLEFRRIWGYCEAFVCQRSN